MVIKSSISDWR